MATITQFFNELDARIRSATNIVQLRNLKRAGRNYVNNLINWQDRRVARKRYSKSLNLIRIQTKRIR
jgi:hypothetical protein